MPQNIRMWEVTPQNTLTEITRSEISLEERLEDWLESDISMLDPDLLVIGKQVPTDFGGTIDLLCLDSTGALVVVELKKGKTPREVTAQALDYASWVKDLSPADLIEIASRYAKIEGSLDKAFEAKFEKPLPEELNLSHRSLIAAPAMDDSTERIVRYLSDLGVPINVAKVQHFTDYNGREMLAQVYLIEPEVVAGKGRADSRERNRMTMRKLEDIARQRGVETALNHLREKGSGVLKFTTGLNGLYCVPVHTAGDRAIMIANPGASDTNKGLEFRLNAIRLRNDFGISKEQLVDNLPEQRGPLPESNWRGLTPEEFDNWEGFQGYFRTTAEIDKFLDGLRAAAQ